MIPEPEEDGQPEPPPTRYTERVTGFGWEVCDKENGWARVAYFPQREHRTEEHPNGHIPAWHAAQAKAAELNEAVD
jgi:hypothetical protein